MAGWDVVEEVPLTKGGGWDVVDEQPVGRQVGLGEAATRSGKGMVAGFRAYAPAPIVGGARIADVIAGLFGKDLGAVNALEPGIAPFLGEMERAAPQPGEQAGVVERALMAAGPQVGKMLPDVAVGMGLQAAAPKIAISAADPIATQVANLLRNSAWAGAPAGMRSGAERTTQLAEQGVPAEQAIPLGAATGLMTTGQFALPATAASAATTLPGRVASRGVQGAAAGVTSGAAQRMAENALLHGGAERLRQDPTDPSALLADAVLSAIFAQAGGRRSPDTAPAARATYESKLALAPDVDVPRAPVEMPLDPQAAAKQVVDRIFATEPGAPEPLDFGTVMGPRGEARPASGLVPRGAPTLPPAQPDVVEARVPVAPDWGTTGPLATSRGRLPRPDAGEVPAPEAPGAILEARVGGTTTPEGTAATTPEEFIFLDVQRTGKGKVVGTGPQVEIVGEGTVKVKGEDVPAYRIRYEGEDGAPVEQLVAQTRVEPLERPAQPRFAQDIAATSYRPPRGVGTGPEQPAPREAAQRISTIEGEPRATAERVEQVDRPPEYRGARQLLPPEGVDRDVTPVVGERRLQAGIRDSDVEGRAVPQEAVEPAPPGERTLTDRLREPGIEAGLRGMAKEAGWAETGGRMVRDEKGNVTDRTAWVAQSEWFGRMRKDMGRQGLAQGEAIRGTIEKALRGEPLKPIETRTVDWMLAELEDFNRSWDAQAGSGKIDAYAADLSLDDVGLTREAAADFVKVEQASRIDEAAVERAAMQFENDAAGFMARVEEIINAGTPETTRVQAAPVRTEAAGGGPEVSGLRGTEQGAAERAAGRPDEANLRAGDVAPERAGARAAAARPDEAGGAVRIDAGQGREGRGELSRTADDAVMGRAAEEMFDLERPTPDVLRMREAAQAREAEAKARVENAPPPEEFGLTGSDRAADVGRAKGQGEIFGGVPRPVVDAVKKAFGSSDQWAESIGGMVRDLKDIAKAPSGSRTSTVARLTREIFDTSSGDIRGELRRWESPTAQKIVDELHVEAGSGRAQKATIQQAAHDWATQRKNELARAFTGLDEAGVEQAVRQVTSGRFGGGAIGEAAKAIRAALDKALEYGRKAGVDMGEQKNYYPRETDMHAVISDPEGYKAALEYAYRRLGQSQKQAEMSARTRYESQLYGDTNWFDPTQRQTAAPFLRERVFGPEVENPSHPLNKFLLKDPVHSLPLYLDRLAQRAEIARRFGDRFAKWDEMARKISDEGAGALVPHLRDYVSTVLGLGRPDVARTGAKAAERIRFWGSLMLLEKAVIASLPETIMPAIRSGNLLDVGRMLQRSLDGLFVKSESHAARKAYAEDLGLIADSMMDHVQAQRWSGGEIESTKLQGWLTKFYRGTGLTGLTNWQIAQAADIGRIFTRRQALDGGKAALRNLADLGIPEAKAKEFTTWLAKTKKGMPEIGDLKGEMGELYQTAISRFAKQAVQQPDASVRPKWQTSSPWGKVVGQIQAFNYSFLENVLKRNYRLAKEGVTGEGYTNLERAKLMMPLAMIPMLTAAGYALREGRDALFADPERRKEIKEAPAWQKLARAISSGSPIAPIDPLMNLLIGARYRPSAAQVLIGPVPGAVVKFVDSLMQFIANNNAQSNAAERKLAKEAWNVFIEPTLQFALLGAPLTPLWGAARIMGPAEPRLREAFISAVAGPEKKQDAAY